MIQLTDIIGSSNASNGNVYPSVEVFYGPYDSLDIAKTKVKELCSEISSGGVPTGITVAVKVGSSLIEYWNPADANIWVQKGGGSGGGINVYTANGISEDTNTNLNNLFEGAAVGDHVVDTQNGGVYICYMTGKWIKLNGTILTDSVPTVARIVNANVLSYK